MGLFGNAFTRSLTPTANALAQYAPLAAKNGGAGSVRDPVPNQRRQQARSYVRNPAETLGDVLATAFRATGQMPGEARRTAQTVVDFSPVGQVRDLRDGGYQTARGVQHGSKAETIGGILAMAIAGAPLPGAIKRSGRGVLEEFMREGSERFLTYQGHSGHVANLHVILNPDGIAEISVDPFSRDPNRFGVGAVRDAAEQLRSLYPEIKGFTGGRESGANPGRQQAVKLK